MRLDTFIKTISKICLYRFALILLMHGERGMICLTGMMSLMLGIIKLVSITFLLFTSMILKQHWGRIWIDMRHCEDEQFDG
jgi:hypothetical protein